MSVFLVVVIPLLTAALLLAVWTKPSARRPIALVGSALHIGTCIELFINVVNNGTVSRQLGGWPSPYGITFRADMLSGLLILMTALVGLSVNLYASENLDRPRREFGFHPLFFVLLGGASGAFVTADLFNLYVWFECILLSSFVLIGLGGEKTQIRGALNYVLPNLVASVLFLTGLGLLYGLCGTLNMADLLLKTPDADPGAMQTIALIFLVAFGLKAAMFPFSSWLPTSYHTPPVAISALFAGLLTKVGVYALYRFFTRVYLLPEGFLQEVLLWAAVGTMVTGGVAALVQRDLKKVVAWILVGHIGTMVIGLGLRDQASIAAGSAYMVQHILTITALYFITGIIENSFGTTRLDKVGFVPGTQPWLPYVAAVPMLALAGIPPFTGFWPKLSLVSVAIDQGRWIEGGTILLSGLLTIIVLAKVYAALFWKPAPEETADKAVCAIPIFKAGSTIVLVVCTLFLTLVPNSLFWATEQAAARLVPDWPMTNLTGGDE